MQPLQTKITWKKCADLPAPACLGQSTVINGSIYFGGFNTGSVKEGCNVYCYDPSQDAWSLLPPPPVWWFGLGQVHKQLVAVGGGRVSDDKMSNEVYVFDEKSQKWKPSFPAMPTARHSPAVISHPSALVVAGGETSERGVYVDTVEIFNIKASKWYSAPSLPMPCRDMSSVSIQDTCYFAGGRGNLAMLNQVLHASIDQLLHNAMLDQDCPDSSDNNQHSSAGWEKLPDTPSYRPTISVLDETIISIGGDSPSSGKPKSEVLVYSLKTGSWIYIGDLPSPCHGAAAAVVSPREMLVIGGWDDDGRKKTVYKGTLNAFV